jgi:Zn-dependent protease
MNLPLEIITQGGFLLDSAGLLGICMVALAAVSLTRKHHSWGGTLMTSGAIALLVGRLYSVLQPYFITREVLQRLGPIAISLHYSLPMVCLTIGLAGVVWGLWGHERWLHEGR